VDVKLARKTLRKAIGEAIKPVLQTAEALVPVETETLKDSLGKKIASYKGGLIITGIAGPRYDKRPKPGKPGKPKKFARMVQRGSKQVERVPTFYAHLVEKGTRPHALGKGSEIPHANAKRRAAQIRKGRLNQHGHMHPGAKAHPFMAPALEKNKGQVDTIIMRFLIAGIQALAVPTKGNP
jgi:HK97 gp10 family phage protein